MSSLSSQVLKERKDAGTLCWPGYVLTGSMAEGATESLKLAESTLAISSMGDGETRFEGPLRWMCCRPRIESRKVDEDFHKTMQEI